MNIENVPLNAEFKTDSSTLRFKKGKGQTDSRPNFLAIQHNLSTCSNGSVETRYEIEKLIDAPDGYTLTETAITYDEHIYIVLIKDTDGAHEIKRFHLDNRI